MKRKIVILNMVLVVVLSFPLFASDQWDTFVSKDEMTEEEIWFDTSPYVEPTETMNFPYHKEACLIVAYDSKNEWAYIAFSEAPNITDQQIHPDDID